MLLLMMMMLMMASAWCLSVCLSVYLVCVFDHFAARRRTVDVYISSTKRRTLEGTTQVHGIAETPVCLGGKYE